MTAFSLRPGPLVGLALASAALAPRPASASQLGGASLSVARSSEALACPDDEVLAARVRALRLGKEETGPLRIDVQIDRDNEGYRARVRVNGPRSGVRELRADGDACNGLSDVLAVSLALLLDEEIQAEKPATPPAPPAADPPAEPPPPPQPYRPRASLRLPVEVGAVAGAPRSLAPALAAGLRLLLPSPLSLGLMAVWTPSEEVSFAGGTVAVSLRRVELSGCFRLLQGRRFEAAGCALASAGQLVGEGSGFAPDRTAERPYVGLGASPQARGPLLPWLSWTARGALLVPLLHERFVVDQQGVAYTQPRASVEAAVGLEIRLW